MTRFLWASLKESIVKATNKRPRLEILERSEEETFTLTNWTRGSESFLCGSPHLQKELSPFSSKSLSGFPKGHQASMKLYSEKFFLKSWRETKFCLEFSRRQKATENTDLKQKLGRDTTPLTLTVQYSKVLRIK